MRQSQGHLELGSPSSSLLLIYVSSSVVVEGRMKLTSRGRYNVSMYFERWVKQLTMPILEA